MCIKVGQSGKGEGKESPRASGGRLEDGRSRELKKNTLPERS